MMLQLINIFLLVNNFDLKRENTIQNSCNFDILRISKNDRKCIDYGKYKNYCNHYSQPEEFIIKNENTLNGKEIIINPKAMWEETNNGRFKVANFYYTFTCDKYNKNPKLIQHIVPRPNYDLHPIYNIIFFVIIILILIIICVYCPHDNNDDNNFWIGYLCGSYNNSYSRYSCD